MDDKKPPLWQDLAAAAATAFICSVATKLGEKLVDRLLHRDDEEEEGAEDEPVSF